jgi:two-component system sensor histidine kinase HydH
MTTTPHEPPLPPVELDALGLGTALLTTEGVVLGANTVAASLGLRAGGRARPETLVPLLAALAANPGANCEVPIQFAGSGRWNARVRDAGGRLHLVLSPAPAATIGNCVATLESVLDSTPDGIMVIDRDRRVRFFNRACGELLGRDPRAVLESNCVCGEVTGCHARDGQSLASQLCPAKELFESDGAAAPGRTTAEMLYSNSRGEERWIETNYSAIRNAEGVVEHVVGVIRDVGERKELEQRLHQTQKLAALGELTAGIAHEIKNPLGIILSSVEVILSDSRPEAMRREAATFIKEEVQRIDGRIRSFLAFARPQPLQCEPTVLNGLVRRTVKSLDVVAGGVEVTVRCDAPEVVLHIDPDQVRQALLNLLLNALEAMGGSGRLVVGTSVVGSQVQLTVEDSGPGIPVELQEKIFNPFFTTKPTGTGLGLALVHRIATAHEGRVTVHDSALGGARFVMSFPVGVARCR